MNQELTERLTFEIRHFTDPESATGEVFIVDVIDSKGECLAEGLGTANRKDAALLEAMREWVSK